RDELGANSPLVGGRKSFSPPFPDFPRLGRLSASKIAAAEVTRGGANRDLSIPAWPIVRSGPRFNNKIAVPSKAPCAKIESIRARPPRADRSIASKCSAAPSVAWACSGHHPAANQVFKRE